MKLSVMFEMKTNQVLDTKNLEEVIRAVNTGLHLEAARVGSARKRTIYVSRLVQTPQNIKLYGRKSHWRVSFIIGMRPYTHIVYKTKAEAIKALFGGVQQIYGDTPGNLASSYRKNADPPMTTFYTGDFNSFSIAHPLKIKAIN